MIRAIGIVVLFTALFQSASYAADAPELTAAEIEKAMALSIRNYHEQMAGGFSARMRLLVNPVGRQDWDLTLTFKRLGSFYSWQQKNNKPLQNDLQGQTIARNSKYKFEIWQRPNTDVWAVQDIVLRGDEKTAKKSVISEQYVEDACNIRLIPLSMPGSIDPMLLFNKKICRIKRIDQSSGSLVKFECEIDYRDNAGKERTAKVTIAFDRDNDWLPVSGHQETVFEDNYYRCEFDQKITAIEQPVGWTIDETAHCVSKTGGRVVDDRKVTQKREIHREVLMEANFTLSEYGLAEPPGIDWTWHIPIYGWALIVAVLCGVLWAQMARRRLRMASPQT